MKSVLVLTLLLNVEAAFGSAGMQEIAQPKYNKVPVDTSGLCTAEVLRADTKKSPPDANAYLKPHCLSIMESLQNEPCIKNKLKQIRMMMLKDIDDKAYQAQQGQGQAANANKSLGHGLECERKADGTDLFKDIVKDEERFNKYMMVFFSAIGAIHTNSRVLHNSSNGSSNAQEIKCSGDDCGFLGIRKKDMDNGKYAQCGCSIENKTDDQKQYDPTMDGHLNIRCGIGMALTEVLDDSNQENDRFEFLDGKSKDDNGKDTRKGIVKIFPFLEHSQADEDDKTWDKEPNSPKEMLKAKMNEYCQTQEAGSTTNEWKREIPDQDPASALRN